MAIFNSFLYVYQRVDIHIFGCNPYKFLDMPGRRIIIEHLATPVRSLWGESAIFLNSLEHFGHGG